MPAVRADTLPPGLDGVEVAETGISDVRGDEGFFHYRGHDAIRLAEDRSFEEVWFLLVEGRLPDQAELAEFRDDVASMRSLPGEVVESLESIARWDEPLAAVRGLYTLAAGALRYRPWIDLHEGELRSQALQTAALWPTLTAAAHRVGRGLACVTPDPDLGHAANYLYMLSGSRPGEREERAVERYLISTIDHGFNASTFAARVVTSTGADLASAVIAALCALSGPLHGGAPGRALEMLDAIAVPEHADEHIRSSLENGDRLMGFGHRVYKSEDPRSAMLREIASDLGGDRVELARHVEQRAVALLEEYKPGRRLNTNVEFYAGVVMEAAGIPQSMFTPTFACGRVVGWSAHILEQATHNRLIRPAARYVGPDPKHGRRLQTSGHGSL